MNNNLKTALTAVTGVVVVGGTIKHTLATIRREEAKRKQIEIDKNLDLQAIATARENMAERMLDGSYPIGSLGRLIEDLHTETKFQKIAIREEF